MAHRANLSGPCSVLENSLGACSAALEAGFGLETDLRRDPTGKFYISHDAATLRPGNRLEDYAALFSKFPRSELAINVKELGYEAELIRLVQTGQLGARSFLFDFELLEKNSPGAAQKTIRNLPGGSSVRLASRLSDRGESISQCLGIAAEVVWADEFDSFWLTEREVCRVQEAGRLFYVISPEIHGFDHSARKRRWADFKNWHIDGLCTDCALEARDFFG